jgi:hypothetical protein
MQIKISAAYAQAFASKKRYIHLLGGRAGGKSHSKATQMLGKCMMSGYYRGVLMREVHASIRDSQFRELKDLIELYGLGQLFQINETVMSFRCVTTGNTIISRGLKKTSKNETAKVKSIKDPTDIWFEEADEISAEDFRKADMSVRTKRGDLQITLSYNTDIDEDHWIRTDFHDQDRDDTFYCHTTYKTNLANLDAAYVQSLERMAEIDPDYYNVYVLGMWGGKKVVAPFAHAFERSRHVGHCHYNPIRPLGIALDFNIDPFAFVYYQYWVEGGKHHLHIFEEEAIMGGTVDEAIRRIKTKFGGALALTTIQGDYNGNNRSMLSADKTSIYKTLQAGLRLSDSQFDLRPNPKHINSRNDVNYFLRHFDDFRIDGKCINTIRDFERVEINPDGSIKKSDRSQGSQRADHLDAVRYLVNGKDVQRWMEDHRRRNGFV